MPVQNENISASSTQNHDQLLGCLDFVRAIVWVISNHVDRSLSEAQPVGAFILPKLGLYDLDLVFILHHFHGVCVVLFLHNIVDHIYTAEFTIIVINIRYISLCFVVQMELHSPL